DPNRFALARELLEGWYGGVGLPNSFDGTYVPPGWQPGGDDQNPPDSATVYTQVFAKECRACHALQAPAIAGGAYIDPRNATERSGAVRACSASSIQPTAPAPLGANTMHQIPMGCYWEFTHSPFFASVIAGGNMPFARRTMDRFWASVD